MTIEPSLLPHTPVVLHHVRQIDPSADIDQMGSVLVANGCLYPLNAEQLGAERRLNLASLPNSIASAIAIDDIQTMDADGWIVGPGLVDLYSHSGEPGFESRETATTLAQSALAGGFTRLALLPDTQPPLDHPGAIARLHQTFSHLEQTPSVYFWGALTQGLEGTQMTELAELAELAEAGSHTKALFHLAGWSDGRAIQDPTLLHRILDYVHPIGKPVALYPQSYALADGGVAREGLIATQLGLAPQPAIAETTALANILECVAATHTPVHIMRVSTARSLTLIQEAKEQGLPVTASTTWMHLLLNSYALSQFDPNLRLDPPLGNPEDQSALVLGLKAGIIDAIAIDHTPYTYEEKTVPFAIAPPGAIGLEFAFPLLWHSLVETGHLTALELWRCLSTHPARCLQQEPPTLTTESVIFDPSREWTITPDALASLSSNSPWLGQPIAGRMVQTWCYPIAA